MVLNEKLNQDKMQGILEGLARRYKEKPRRSREIAVIDSQLLRQSHLEAIAVTTFTKNDYQLNATTDGEEYNVESEIAVQHDLPDISANVPLGRVMHQLMLREDQEKTEGKVGIDMHIEADGVSGKICLPERNIPAYTEAAHFLTRVMSMYGSDNKIRLLQLMEIGYEHIVGTGEEAPEGYEIDFMLRPELTRITLKAGDEDLPLENTEFLDEKAFEVRRFDGFYTKVEYSRNPMRESLDLPAHAKYIKKEDLKN